MEILSPPNLIPTVKNYWFFYGNDGPFQFVFAYGTTVNFMRGKGLTGTYPNYGVLFWGHHPKEGKMVRLETSAKVPFPPESGLFSLTEQDGALVLEHADSRLEFGGEYAPGAEGIFLRSSRFNNQFRETKGKLFGKRFKGKGYIQKVEVMSPFSSWDWLRFHGKSWGEGYQISRIRKPTLYFNGETYPVDMEAVDGVQKFTGDGVDLRTEPYADYSVIFRGLGRFRYTEFFVKVEGKVDGQRVSDYGMVEEARGFII